MWRSSMKCMPSPLTWVVMSVSVSRDTASMVSCGGDVCGDCAGFVMLCMDSVDELDGVVEIVCLGRFCSGELCAWCSSSSATDDELELMDMAVSFWAPWVVVYCCLSSSGCVGPVGGLGAYISAMLC